MTLGRGITVRVILGRRITFAHFHRSGTRDSLIELFAVEVNSSGRIGAKSHSILLGTPSGPKALAIIAKGAKWISSQNIPTGCQGKRYLPSSYHSKIYKMVIRPKGIKWLSGPNKSTGHQGQILTATSDHFKCNNYYYTTKRKKHLTIIVSVNHQLKTCST